MLRQGQVYNLSKSEKIKVTNDQPLKYALCGKPGEVIMDLELYSILKPRSSNPALDFFVTWVRDNGVDKPLSSLEGLISLPFN